MTNFASNQNEQVPMSPQELKADNPKSLSRRSWIRKAAITATSAVMLLFVLSGCTKEQWDDVIEKVPGGGLGSAPSGWYYLKATYKDRNGDTLVGYLGAVSQSAGSTDYDNMRMGSQPYATKFKPEAAEAGDGWQYLETDDGWWLSARLSQWLFRSAHYNRIAWKIVGGKLYTNYTNSVIGTSWNNLPVGSIFDSGPLTTAAEYVGLGMGTPLTNCELVQAPAP